jgi:Mor family transcriptional regulator
MYHPTVLLSTFTSRMQRSISVTYASISTAGRENAQKRPTRTAVGALRVET